MMNERFDYNIIPIYIYLRKECNLVSITKVSLIKNFLHNRDKIIERENR